MVLFFKIYNNITNEQSYLFVFFIYISIAVLLKRLENLRDVHEVTLAQWKVLYGNLNILMKKK